MLVFVELPAGPLEVESLTGNHVATGKRFATGKQREAGRYEEANHYNRADTDVISRSRFRHQKG